MCHPYEQQLTHANNFQAHNSRFVSLWQLYMVISEVTNAHGQWSMIIQVMKTLTDFCYYKIIFFLSYFQVFLLLPVLYYFNLHWNLIEMATTEKSFPSVKLIKEASVNKFFLYNGYQPNTICWIKCCVLLNHNALCF